MGELHRVVVHEILPQIVEKIIAVSDPFPEKTPVFLKGLEIRKTDRLEVGIIGEALDKILSAQTLIFAVVILQIEGVGKTGKTTNVEKNANVFFHFAGSLRQTF
jgi:hypothetical protein